MTDESGACFRSVFVVVVVVVEGLQRRCPVRAPCFLWRKTCLYGGVHLGLLALSCKQVADDSTRTHWKAQKSDWAREWYLLGTRLCKNTTVS